MKKSNSTESSNACKPLLANRLLRFRAWDGKEMLKDIIPMNNYAIIRVQGLENTTSYCYYVPVQKIMQYTELCDKNGLEIYEGDILLDKQIDDIEDKDTYSYFQVLFDNQTGQYAIDVSFSKNRESLVNITDYFDEDIEVVGNIFENKDLL